MLNVNSSGYFNQDNLIFFQVFYKIENQVENE